MSYGVQLLHLPFWQRARGSCKSENWRNWTPHIYNSVSNLILPETEKPVLDHILQNRKTSLHVQMRCTERPVFEDWLKLAKKSKTTAYSRYLASNCESYLSNFERCGRSKNRTSKINLIEVALISIKSSDLF